MPGLKIRVSVVRFRPWAPCSATLLEAAYVLVSRVPLTPVMSSPARCCPLASFLFFPLKREFSPIFPFPPPLEPEKGKVNQPLAGRFP